MPQPDPAAAEELNPGPPPTMSASPAGGEGLVAARTGVESATEPPHPAAPPPTSPAGGEVKPGHHSKPMGNGGGDGQPFFYGGQAVIEGVMMRGKRHYAVAVRLPATK